MNNLYIKDIRKIKEQLDLSDAEEKILADQVAHIVIRAFMHSEYRKSVEHLLLTDIDEI